MREIMLKKFCDAALRIALTFDTPVFISVFLNIREVSFSTALGFISFISAILVLMLFLFLPIYFAVKLVRNKHKLEDQEFKGKFGGLYEGFKLDSNWTILFYQLFLLRRLLLTAALIFCTFSVYF